ncbi:AraC family transcriptional regulator [Trabulsiella odontotermitis]|uniref:AraC family transcriptional regulator n=1 Tax=Trabulsiella odontotermitis TaxID=379893 RepID=UPI0006BA11B8|nr:AraC family transcriptional regulator [Trabulsiella odontotermitis]
MSVMTETPASGDWIDFRRDTETGIESVSAHFKGHAYDSHDHEELLLGVTLQGSQRFNCHRALHTSTPGKAILIEPGAVHDGYAAQENGFTYSMLYIPQQWVSDNLQKRSGEDISIVQAAFRNTLTDDRVLIMSIVRAFNALHNGEGRLARDESLDLLLSHLMPHVDLKPADKLTDSLIRMNRVRDYLIAHLDTNPGLDELASISGVDRFRLSRQFKSAFGQSPHAYLVRLRLRTARQLLASGISPSMVALQTGFADQSHLGRWFRRAYRLSPAAYQKYCSNVLY